MVLLTLQQNKGDGLFRGGSVKGTLVGRYISLVYSPAEKSTGGL
jgi:hypothetical protein